MKKIRIIDFDLVSVSSLNRHAFSYREDVGTSKVASIKNYIKKISPETEVECFEEFLNKENVEKLLSDNPDFVADCIDDIDTKVELLAFCKERNIKVVSSGGAGMKSDPTKIQIRDISNCSYDSLTRRIREGLRKRGFKEGIPVVFSIEKCERELLPLNEFQQEDPDNFRQLPNMRLRIVPVLGTMPSIFGIVIANYILSCIGEDEPIEVGKNDNTGRKFYVKMMAKLRNSVNNLGLVSDFDLEDLYFSAREVWNGRDSIDGKKKNHMFLAVWDRSKVVDGCNFVLVNQAQAKKMNKEKNLEKFEEIKKEVYGDEGIERVEEVLRKARLRYERDCKNLYTLEYSK